MRRISLFIPLIAFPLTACQSGSQSVGVQVQPSTAQVVTLTTQKFTVDVSGTLYGNVTWSIAGGRTDAGTIAADGTYTAPVKVPKNDVVQIVATSLVDPTKTATATVNVLPVPMFPQRGPTSGGTKVIIDGQNFDESTQVLFGGVPGTGLVVDSPLRIQITTPPNASIAPVDVRVVTGKGTLVYPQAFHYAASVLRFAGGAYVETCQYSNYTAVVSDVFGDGKSQALAVTCGQYPYQVQVLVPDGTGSFQQPFLTLPLNGAYPYNLFAGDFDGDGKTDLFVVDYYGVQVFYNRSAAGTVSFAPGPSLPLPTGTSYYYFSNVQAVDLYKRGKADLVFMSYYYYSTPYGYPQVYVEPNNGMGTGVGATTSFSTQPYEYGYNMAVGDVDGDGFPDIAVDYTSTSGTGSFGGFAWYKSNGVPASPAFGLAAHQSLPSGFQPQSMAMGRLRGSTMPNDILLGMNTSPNGLMVEQNNGGGVFTGTAVPSGNYPLYYPMSLTDLDHDGFPDLVSFGYEPGPGTKIFYGSAGGFGALSFVPTGYSYNTYALNLKGTGDLDLITNAQNSQLGTFLSQGARQYGAPPINVGNGPQGSLGNVAKSGNDGEVLVPLFSGGTCGVGICGAVATLDEQVRPFASTVYSLPMNASAASVRTVNVSQTAVAQDALVVDQGSFSGGVGAVWILQGDGQGGFHPPRAVRTGDEVFDAAVGDLDGDGIADLVVSHRRSGSTTGGTMVFWGTGPATFNTNGQVVTTVQSPGTVQVADLLGDGTSEIVVTDQSGGSTQPGQLAIVKFGGRAELAPVYVPTGSLPSRVLVADANGDWIPDLIVSATYQSAGVTLTEIDVILGLGGLFEYDLPQVYRFSGTVNNMMLGDVDGDSMDDLVLTIQGTGLAIMRGYDGGRFLDPQFIPAGADPAGVTIAHLSPTTTLNDLVVTDLSAGRLLPLPNGSR